MNLLRATNLHEIHKVLVRTSRVECPSPDSTETPLIIHNTVHYVD